MPPFSTIRTSSEAGVLQITLDRPKVLNALNEEMSVELTAAVRLAQRDDQVRCVLLTGAGRAFCAGQDLKQLERLRASGAETAGADLAALLREHYNPMLLSICDLEKPVVAAINGLAVGAGASLALAADLRIAGKSASLLMAFVNIGLVPDCGATLTLLREAGYARAAELCFLGEPLPAEEAQRYGLVNRVVDDAQLEAAAQELARQLAAGPTRAIGLTKRALRRAWTATLDEQLEYEALLQDTAGQTADHQEGLAAFLGKRPAHFQGS